MSRVGQGGNNLEEITISLEIMFADLVDSPESDVLEASRYLWDFDTILTAGQFSKLNKLVLYICSLDEVDTQVARALLQSHFPGLSTHGILSVIPTTMTPEELEATLMRR